MLYEKSELKIMKLMLTTSFKLKFHFTTNIYIPTYHSPPTFAISEENKKTH